MSDSDSDVELEVLPEPAVRLMLFINPLTFGFCEAACIGSCAPALSFSSSASLSELDFDVDDDDGLIFDRFLVFLLGFCSGVVSFISTSDSISSWLLSLPLLPVMSFAMTVAAVAPLAFASAFTFFETLIFFLGVLTTFALSLLSLLLLLVSSACNLS